MPFSRPDFARRSSSSSTVLWIEIHACRLSRVASAGSSVWRIRTSTCTDQLSPASSCTCGDTITLGSPPAATSPLTSRRPLAGPADNAEPPSSITVTV